MRIFLFLLPLLLLLSACAEDPKPEWKFGEDAITIIYRAALDLNAVNDRPHSLMLVIYQLKDINEFNRFAGYQEGLKKLLEAKIFDPSVMSMKKNYVEPGGARHITLNRAEHVRFVGIVAGYYDLLPSRCSTVLDIEYETERHGLLKIWKNTNINSLGINLVLGRDGLRVKRERNYDS
ncbi:MAG: type VI secretion system lipoprotein TssJ [Candidatus Electrothrix sp. AR4]|nr:type VI secretion system lipoprotein TssJ [Candidatus Electrothrix sp. AR4]